MQLYFPGLNAQRRRDKTERGISNNPRCLLLALKNVCKLSLHSCTPVVMSSCIITYVLTNCPVFYSVCLHFLASSFFTTVSSEIFFTIFALQKQELYM
jgi:hypothetical protein